jgi:prevent-host-death family protein
MEARTISADEVQAHLLDLLEEHAEFVITKDGEPVARVVPITESRRRLTLEELRRSIRIVGDIMEPVDEWDVEK